MGLKIKKNPSPFYRFFTDFFVPRVTEGDIVAFTFSLIFIFIQDLVINTKNYTSFDDTLYEFLISFIITPAAIIAFLIFFIQLLMNERLAEENKMTITAMFYIGFALIMINSLWHALLINNRIQWTIENFVIAFQIFRYGVLLVILRFFYDAKFFISNRLSDIQIRGKEILVVLLLCVGIGLFVFNRYDFFSVKVALTYSYSLFAFYAVRSILFGRSTQDYIRVVKINKTK